MPIDRHTDTDKGGMVVMMMMMMMLVVVVLVMMMMIDSDHCQPISSS